MSFRGVFAAVFLGTALIVAAVMVNAKRPARDTTQPSPAFVKATGKCAECHQRETSAVVHEFEMSKHSQAGINCLDCHKVSERQEALEHRGFSIAKKVTAANCAQCHKAEYDQYLRSRHAAPAWAAVAGKGDFTAEQILFSETYHKGAVDRPPHDLMKVEGNALTTKGCRKCHDIGQPNADGSIGSCTACHSRHAASVSLARTPETCGQCHMGPDHSQIEIYHESKHGVLFNAQKGHMNLDAPPKHLTTKDMPVPTCTTCHMSGLEGQKVTHDVTERLSYWLFAPVSQKRPDFNMAQANMKEVCLKCHTTPRVETFYKEATAVLEDTNKVVQQADAIMKELRAEKRLTPEPFDEPIEYLYFDLWHYFGRTAKHGAFMGGADFVQWHGAYELALKTTELKRQAEELRAKPKEASRANAPAH